ncbi:MAG TPA: hypothetical protein DDZ51_25440 [Planctomycetaceae bacterium]|nr:hypothetical protein [Planctomycetaceae bacterium]
MLTVGQGSDDETAIDQHPLARANLDDTIGSTTLNSQRTTYPPKNGERVRCLKQQKKEPSDRGSFVY